MKIIPVLDIRAGVVVHGVGGRRQEYRPLVSKLTEAQEPAPVARALHDHFGFAEIYVADLDAIAGREPDLATYAKISALGYTLWVDAGIRDARAAARVAACTGLERIVVGLETVQAPQVLQRLCSEHGDRIVFSLDLKEGAPLGDLSTWHGKDAESIAAEAESCGVSRLIVLDLARVGMGDGTATEGLCARLASLFPHLEVIAAGGIRNIGDLTRLKRAGARGALVCSALHQGALSAADLGQLTPVLGPLAPRP
jgi:phosphoribosylformimino-5-aminoimidazole carboxamide ribotide isomerase